MSKTVTPFLTTYQTDKPMVPFLAADLHMMLKTHAGSQVSVNLLDVDIKLPTNYMDCSCVDLGNCHQQNLKEVEGKAKGWCKHPNGFQAVLQRWSSCYGLQTSTEVSLEKHLGEKYGLLRSCEDGI